MTLLKGGVAPLLPWRARILRSDLRMMSLSVASNSLRKQPTFGDATTGFSAKSFGGDTGGSVAKYWLFSQATSTC